MYPQKSLPEETFQILLTLMEGEAHGYAIMQRIAERSAGGCTLLPGALYRRLHRLLADEWVAEVDEQPHSRRRRYRITARGERALQHDAQRLVGLVAEARRLGLVNE